MAKKIATPEETKEILTDNITLCGILCEMESCRKNGITNHRVNVYRDLMNYSVKGNFEDNCYDCEIYNNRSGEEYYSESFSIPFDFEVELFGGSSGDISV